MSVTSGTYAKAIHAENNDWATIGNPREITAYGELRSLFKLTKNDIIITGFGTMDERELEGFASIDDAFDLEVPSQNMIYEVTGYSGTLGQSLSACLSRGYPVQEPQLFFRSGKVEKAKIEKVVKKLVFVSVNEKVDIRFVPCSWLLNAPLVENLEFRGCEPYHRIDWLSKAMLGGKFKEWMDKKSEGINQ